MQVNVTFVSNTAGSDGAAIYATSIDRCTYVPSYNKTNLNTTKFEMSIFKVSSAFKFRYIIV